MRPCSAILTIGQQADELNDTLRGHYAYYGVGGNIRALQRVYRHVECYWRLPVDVDHAALSWPGSERLSPGVE